MKLDRLLPLLTVLATAALFSCSPSGGPAPSRSGSDFVSPAANRPANGVTSGLRSGDQAINRNNIDAILNSAARPGLATGWGNEKTSSVMDQRFVRQSSKPVGTDAIYYNNKAGIEAMAGSSQANSLKRINGMQSAAGGMVEWGVKGKLGLLATYMEEYYTHRYFGIIQNGRRLVAGEANGTYSIVVKNRCKSTLEIVASVDGLDVMDGKAASFSKRGYLVDPGDTLEIDGFRTSSSSVAAFKFSSVANSYANMRHGDTRNVGVLGIAVFTQKGVNPWVTREVERRGRARAFAEAP